MGPFLTALVGKLPAIAGAVGSAASNIFGAKYSAKRQEELTREQQQINIQEAQKNRDFQERMSNTAYQRAAKDLEGAGLNRILALGSAASSPGGATASPTDLGSSAKALDELSNTGSKTMAGALAGANVASAIQTVKNQKAQEQLTRADTVLRTRQALAIEPAVKAGEGINSAIDVVDKALKAAGRYYGEKHGGYAAKYNKLENELLRLKNQIQDDMRSSAKSYSEDGIIDTLEKTFKWTPKAVK